MVKSAVANQFPADWKQVTRIGSVLDTLLETLEAPATDLETLTGHVKERLGCELPEECPLLWDKLQSLSLPIEPMLIRDWLLSTEGYLALTQLSAFKPHNSP